MKFSILITIVISILAVGCSTIKVFPKNSYMQSSAMHQENVKYIQPILVIE